MKPAVMEPSHMPRTKRTTKRPAKFLQAAWQHKAIAQIKMFRLEVYHVRLERLEKVCKLPHPFSDGKLLQCQVLWKLEKEITKVEDRSQPDCRE
jgi:hypothetical protein